MVEAAGVELDIGSGTGLISRISRDTKRSNLSIGSNTRVQVQNRYTDFDDARSRDATLPPSLTVDQRDRRSIPETQSPAIPETRGRWSPCGGSRRVPHSLTLVPAL